jgi:hypothetical protein
MTPIIVREYIFSAKEYAFKVQMETRKYQRFLIFRI